MDDKDVVRALGGVEASIKSLAAQQDLTRTAVEAQGKIISSLPCNFHRRTLQSVDRKIDDLCERVGAEEMSTQRLEIERDVRGAVKKDGVALWKILVPAGCGAVATIIAALVAACA